MNVEQFEIISNHLGRIAAALEAIAGKAGTGSLPAATVPDSPWDSPDVPAGYDTVLGYMAKENPEALTLLDDPIFGTQRDGFWLTHQASRRGIKVIKVQAPRAMADMGIDSVNAYPVSLLAERMD